jgi:DedD protein
MDAALKQRLIGAAVLVALAVIFLPMLLGGPGPSPSRHNEVSLEIPAAPDRPLQTREIPLALPAPAVDPVRPTAADPVPDAADSVVTVDAVDLPRRDARPELAESDAIAGTAGSGTSEPVTPAPPAAPAADPVRPPAAVAAAPASAPAAPPAAVSPAGSRFVVNLGSYSQRGNAEALLARLRAAGMTVYSEAIEVDGKPATRLRGGPFASRAEAEAARLQARRVEDGLSASVVALDAADPAAAPVRPAVAAGFAVQVGAFKSETEAQALRGRLAGAGFAAYVERTRTDDGTLWRVRAGPELQRDRAERLREAIRSKLKLDGLVVGHP